MKYKYDPKNVGIYIGGERVEGLLDDSLPVKIEPTIKESIKFPSRANVTFEINEDCMKSFIKFEEYLKSNEDK
jgi:hypothetical protein